MKDSGPPYPSILTMVLRCYADMLLEDDSSLLEDLGGGVGLPLPDVASPHWLGGMGPSNSDPGPAAGTHRRLSTDHHLARHLLCQNMLSHCHVRRLENLVRVLSRVLQLCPLVAETVRLE